MLVQKGTFGRRTQGRGKPFFWGSVVILWLQSYLSFSLTAKEEEFLMAASLTMYT